MDLGYILSFAAVAMVLGPPASAQGLLGGAIKGFGELIGSEEIKRAGENLDRLHAQIKDQLPVYKGLEEGGSRIVREAFVQPCIAPFQALTNWSMATAGYSSAGSQEKVDEAIVLLVQTGVLPLEEFDGVSMRWSALSGAHGMAPDRNVILLDTAYRGESTIALAALIAHEMMHIIQYRRMGSNDFKCAYSRHFVECGFCQDDRHPMEREAYAFGRLANDRMYARLSPDDLEHYSVTTPVVPLDLHACNISGFDVRIDELWNVKPYGSIRVPGAAPHCAFDIIGVQGAYCVNRADGAVLKQDQVGRFFSVGVCRPLR